MKQKKTLFFLAALASASAMASTGHAKALISNNIGGTKGLGNYIDDGNMGHGGGSGGISKMVGVNDQDGGQGYDGDGTVDLVPKGSGGKSGEGGATFGGDSAANGGAELAAA